MASTFIPENLVANKTGAKRIEKVSSIHFFSGAKQNLPLTNATL
jgi:hypothetical protein